jgi:hypothetical protein
MAGEDMGEKANEGRHELEDVFEVSFVHRTPS